MTVTHIRNFRLRDIPGPLHNIHIQSLANMPRDMAMQWPHPRIISIKLQHEIARLIFACSGLYHLRVSSLRIDGVDCAIPCAYAFGYDPGIVAVEMHGVGDVGYVVVQYDADGGVGTEVVDIPLGVGWVGCVSLVGEEEERITMLVLVYRVRCSGGYTYL